jgi:hypothetical protein
MCSRELDAGTQRVSNTMMTEHLIKPSKDHNIIHSFLATLKRDMKTLSQNLIIHEVTLEALLFPTIILIPGYHEIWVAYIRDKDKGKF